MSLKIVFVTNSSLSKKNISQILKDGIIDKIDAVLLRENKAYYEKYADEILNMCKSKKVEFITHNFVDYAINNDLKNIHFSFEYFYKVNKTKIKNFNDVNVSIHNKKELEFVTKNGASSIIYGNIFKTTSHPNRKAKGLENLQNLMHLTNLDIYAIGGINLQNIAKFQNLKIKGVCMMSEFML